jgi:hypothetical protein
MLLAFAGMLYGGTAGFNLNAFAPAAEPIQGRVSVIDGIRDDHESAWSLTPTRSGRGAEGIISTTDPTGAEVSQAWPPRG